MHNTWQPHPLINMENYIPYKSTVLLAKHLKILQEHAQLTRWKMKKGGRLSFLHYLKNYEVTIY